MSFLHGDRLFGEEVATGFEKLNSDSAVVSFKYEKVFDVSNMVVSKRPDEKFGTPH